MKPAKQLYQWDVNQYLTGINPSAQFVDYPIGDEVIRIKSDGTRCRIPDEILQTYGGKTCYERYPNGTYRAYSFTVLYAPKPPDYVYTPEERTTFEALTARVDAAIEEIKRRADSGEFTPKKGVDYFTDAEKAEMMESVSSGAVGEFRNVVDSATTEYNANATEKLTTYNSNATEKFKAYNDNHTEKMTAYDTNATDKLSTYNSNAEQKLESYNSNHTEKLTEYNANAETKTAEFDANAAALQTEVDRLRGECDNLAAENRKQENRIDALMKLNKGQTYDILPEEGETASRTAPSGAKYVSVDKVGGNSVVWNQQIDYSRREIWANSYDVYGTKIASTTNREHPSMGIVFDIDEIVANHKYMYIIRNPIYSYNGSGAFNRWNVILYNNWQVLGNNLIFGNSLTSLKGIINTSSDGTESTLRVFVSVEFTSKTAIGDTFAAEDIQLFDITLMFGSTIADYIYSLEQSQAGAGVSWFKKLFPADYYPYSEPTIISSQTDRVDMASADSAVTQQITTGFPALNSAGSVYDYIDLNEGKLHQRVGVVDLGTLDWMAYSLGVNTFRAIAPSKAYGDTNILCAHYTTEVSPFNNMTNQTIRGASGNAYIYIRDNAYTNASAFKTAVMGQTLVYELADEVITDIEIPTELTDWLPVEAGGSVTFHNADESKQLAVPNAVSWVRKLDEVN